MKYTSLVLFTWCMSRFGTGRCGKEWEKEGDVCWGSYYWKFRVRSQHPPTQRILRGHIWSSVELSTKNPKVESFHTVRPRETTANTLHGTHGQGRGHPFSLGSLLPSLSLPLSLSRTGFSVPHLSCKLFVFFLIIQKLTPTPHLLALPVYPPDFMMLYLIYTFNLCSSSMFNKLHMNNDWNASGI